MLDKLSAVLHLSADGQWSSVMGELPASAGLAALKEMAQARPAARKFEAGMAITVPLPDGDWHFWLLSSVLGVNELPGVMTRLQDLSKGISGSERIGKPITSSDGSNDRSAGVLAKVAARTVSAKRIKPKALAPMLLDSLIEQGHGQRCSFKVHGTSQAKSMVIR